MLQFFRRIRRELIDQTNLKSYLFYAVGEILLVMIGILLALQVNNWNESFKKHKAEREEYAAVIAHLQLDLSRQKQILDYAGLHEKVVNQIAYEIFIDSTDHKDCNFEWIIRTLDYYSFVEENHHNFTGEIPDKDIVDKFGSYFFLQYGAEQGLIGLNATVKDVHNYFCNHGIWNLKNAASFEGHFNSDPNMQIIHSNKLISLKNDESLQGRLAVLKTWLHQVTEKMSALIKTNEELQILLSQHIAD